MKSTHFIIGSLLVPIVLMSNGCSFKFATKGEMEMHLNTSSGDLLGQQTDTSNLPGSCGAKQEGTTIQGSQVTAHYCQTYTKERGRLLTQEELDKRAREQLQAAIQTEISGTTRYETTCHSNQAGEDCSQYIHQQIDSSTQGVLTHVTKEVSNHPGDCTCVTLSTKLASQTQLSPNVMAHYNMPVPTHSIATVNTRKKVFSGKEPILVAALLKEMGYCNQQLKNNLDKQAIIEALELFQQESGLWQSGTVDHQTWKELSQVRLRKSTIVSLLATTAGNEFIRMVASLKEMGYFNKPLGNFKMADFEIALKKFQRDIRVPQNGQLDSKTRHELKRVRLSKARKKEIQSLSR